MTAHTLDDLGWSHAFARQIDDAEAHLEPARVAEVHRSQLVTLGPNGLQNLHPNEPAHAYAVGDWVLSDGTNAIRRLTPNSDLRRKSAGETATDQRIAANVDTVGIVTSCNDDFNIARLERYLAVVFASDALPLVILTKADLAPNPTHFRNAAERLSPLVTAIALNAKDTQDAQLLTPWCNAGQTLALLGSSGVGKTTLRNALTGEDADTQGIREDDARGRHTTTYRALRPTQSGGWLIDTPGMRELQLSGTSDGIETLFDDIEAIADQCKFSDCAHETEPGCAIKTALDKGKIDADRLARWQKLKREDQYNTESIAQSRARNKSFTKLVKKTMSEKTKRKR